jgi:tRNA-binding EMAP/Myf-like protein
MLRGMESKGMILFAEDGKHVKLVTTEAPDGNAVN